MSKHRRKKKKEREKRVKVKLAKRKVSIRHDAKMERETQRFRWEYRERIEPIRNPDKKKNKKDQVQT
jgi:hypothetical protein